MELTEFLLARVAEDEADAMVGWRWKALPAGEYERLQARVLAECEAKRRIVELADAAFSPDVDPIAEHHAGNDGPWVGSVTLKLLALPFADHADYDPEWKP